MKKWAVKHTVYEDDDSGVESRFTGGAGGWFGYHLLSGMITVVTLGIGAPWGQKILLRWETEHTEIGGSGLVFFGTGGQIFLKYIVFALLTPLTLGIYALFFPVSLLKWQFSHTARGTGPASETGVSVGVVIAGVTGLALIVTIVVVALVNVRVQQGKPQLESRPNAFEQHIALLDGQWTSASREENLVYVCVYEISRGNDIVFRVTEQAYENTNVTHLSGVGEDAYGWYPAPGGYSCWEGDRIAYTQDGDGFRIDGKVYNRDTGASRDILETIVFVNDDRIQKDGAAYVRGSHTLTECAKLFGFSIEFGEAGQELDMERLLAGTWSTAYRDGDVLITKSYSFGKNYEIVITACEYNNENITHFPDAGGDEYGWYVAPKGHPVLKGAYSLTDLGDGYFTMAADTYGSEIGFAYQLTCEISYVDANAILIDGQTFVRGSYTLEEYAEIFGFEIEVKAILLSPLVGEWSIWYASDGVYGGPVFRSLDDIRKNADPAANYISRSTIQFLADGTCGYNGIDWSSVLVLDGNASEDMHGILGKEWVVSGGGGRYSGTWTYDESTGDLHVSYPQDIQYSSLERDYRVRIEGDTLYRTDMVSGETFVYYRQ